MTEKSGRVHTSAVSIAILPQADEVAIISCNPAEIFLRKLYISWI